MNLIEAVIDGTLKPDGTLVLDHKPNLPPGRVTVRMQSMTTMVDDPFFEMLNDIWTARANAGLVPRSAEEVEAQRQRLRDETEQEILQAGRLQDEGRPGQTKPSTGAHE